MKRKYFGLIAVLLLFFVPHVYAISFGTSYGNENYEGFMSTDSNQEYTVKPGGRHTIVLDYKYEDDISRIDVNINAPQGISVSSSSSQLGSNDSLTGSGGSYKININDGEESSGTALFILNFPNVNTFTEITVTANAKVYDKNGSLKENASISVKYNVLEKPSNCDNNLDVTVTIDNNNVQSVDSLFGPEFNLTTDNSTANIKVVPNSSSTKIAYLGDSFTISSDNPPNYLSNQEFNNQNLNYGENSYVFMLESDCSRQSDTIRQKLMGIIIIGGTDWFHSSFYNPGIASVTITRNDNRSRVNTLKSLTISDLAINFNPDLKTYMGTVPYKVSSVKINSSLTDIKSSYVPGFGNRNVNLNEGMNDVLVKVKAENGDEAVYTIKINRELNDDASLRNIKVNDKDITIKNGVLKYSVQVDNEIVNPTVIIEANDAKAKIEKDEIKDLQEGSNTFNITVTASNGNKLVYVLDIIRDTLVSTNSKLKNIIIKNHDFKFNGDKEEFDVHITSEEEKLDLEIIPENEKAKYVVIGNKNLKNGSQIKIKVTAEDEETISNYTINITKDSKKINILFIIIPSFIILIGICIVFITKKKAKKEKIQSEIVNDIPKAQNDSMEKETVETNVSNDMVEFEPIKKSNQNEESVKEIE